MIVNIDIDEEWARTHIWIRRDTNHYTSGNPWTSFYNIYGKSDELVLKMVCKENYYSSDTIATIRKHRPHLVDRIEKLLSLK